MKTKKYWVGINPKGRVLLSTLSPSKASLLHGLLRSSGVHYTLKSLERAGIRIVPCELHFAPTAAKASVSSLITSSLLP